MEGVATQTEFGFSEAALSLPTHCRRQPVERFAVERIVLAKGSLDTPQREAFVRQVSEAYPKARTEEKLGVPHNRIEIPGKTALERIARGKRTLVFGSISPKNAVWERELRNNVFDHEWALSVYGFCPYNCAYCYLAALPGVWFSPAVRIYVNLAEIIAEVSRRAMAAGRRTTFYQGTLQDGLALDPLTAYSTVLVPFFAEHRHARAFVQTKSANIERLLHLRHNAHTALSWTLSPRPIAERFETNAPSVDARLAAMERCANAGYPVCANFIPVIPYGDWEAFVSGPGARGARARAPQQAYSWRSLHETERSRASRSAQGKGESHFSALERGTAPVMARRRCSTSADSATACMGGSRVTLKGQRRVGPCRITGRAERWH